LTVNFLMPVFGAFPDIDASGGLNAADGDILGELSMFALNFTPRSYASLDGQLQAINSNSTLFSLLLNEFGGDFMINTFGLPDVRGRVLLGTGQGVGLVDRIFAESGGAETHVLSIDEMPLHRHGVVPPDSPLCIVIPVAGGGVVTPCL